MVHKMSYWWVVAGMLRCKSDCVIFNVVVVSELLLFLLLLRYVERLINFLKCIKTGCGNCPISS